jgi:hypothetical protein
MGEARRRKQMQEQNKPVVDLDRHDLPISHYEWARSHHKNLFKFLEGDLKRLSRDNLQVEDILPPNSTCNEDDYLLAYMSYLRTQPDMQQFFTSPIAIEALANQLLREYRSLMAYVHGGRKTYYFSEGLTEGLCCTALNAPCSAFKLPVPGLQLVYANLFAREAMAALSKSAEGVYEDSVISVYVREDNLDIIGCRRLLIVGFERRGDIHAPRGFSRQLALRDDWTLEQALHTDWDKLNLQAQNELPGPGVYWGPGHDETMEFRPGDAQPFLDEGLMVIRMVVNSVLYITSRNAELAEKLWPRHVEPPLGEQRENSEHPGPDRWTLVGEHVDPVPIILDPRVQHDLGTPLKKHGLRYKVRFLVPGFWRRPPNSAPDAQKSVWVKHHFRGPEMADVISNPYIVR